MKTDLEHRFWAKVDIQLTDECWNWLGASRSTRHGQDYGQIKIDGFPQPAHRVAWELTHGLIPAGLLVLHSCDNPPCVNPAHLRLGTSQDNTDDMTQRRRNRRASSKRPRKTHCPLGHPYAGTNLYERKDGRRQCRICRRHQAKIWKRQKRAQTR